MKLSEKIKENLHYIKNNILYNGYEQENDDYKITRKDKKVLKHEKNLDETSNIEEVDNSPKTRKKEKKSKNEEKSQKRRLRIERKVNKNYDKYINRIQESMTLLEKLESLKMQLENQKLTPWRRLILQIKFSRIQTKLDKQIAYIDMEEFRQQCQLLKYDTRVKYEKKLEDFFEEYNEILDEQYETETLLQDLTGNMKEIKKDASTYQYQTKPENLVNIEEMNQQLGEIIKRKEEKEQQMREVYQEGQERWNKIDKAMNKKSNKQLRKYNAVVIQWNTIKTFFRHIAENVTDWWQNKGIEKDAQKGLSKEEKKNSKIEVRKNMANMRNTENETIVENFRARLHYNTLQDKPEENVQEEIKQEELQETEQQEELQENEMNPVLQLYIEESAKEGFDETKFFDKYAWSKTSSYTLEQIEEGMKGIERYKEEHNTQAEELSEEEIRRRKIQEYFEKQEALRQELKEKQARLKGKKFEYKDGNYVPVEDEMQKEEKVSANQEKEQNETEVIEKSVVQEETLTPREKIIKQNEMGPILKQYIEEKSKPDFSREKFVKEIASANNTYSIEAKRKGMQEIDLYEQEKKREQMANMNPILRQYIEESVKEGFDKNEFMDKVKRSANLTGREKLIAIKEIDNYIEQQKMPQEESKEIER